MARRACSTASRWRRATGEVVSLLGRNGAGKSTTLKAIVGLVEVTGGSISLDGRALTGLPTHEISRLGVGWVPEDRRIFSDLTVAENLLVGAKGGGGWSVTRVFDYFPEARADGGAPRRQPLRRRAADAHGGAHSHGEPAYSPPRRALEGLAPGDRAGARPADRRA